MQFSFVVFHVGRQRIVRKRMYDKIIINVAIDVTRWCHFHGPSVILAALQLYSHLSVLKDGRPSWSFVFYPWNSTSTDQCHTSQIISLCLNSYLTALLCPGRRGIPRLHISSKMLLVDLFLRQRRAPLHLESAGNSLLQAYRWSAGVMHLQKHFN